VVLVKASNSLAWRVADALTSEAGSKPAGSPMRQILIAVAIALTVSILLTPALIRLFTRQGFGHQIREDGRPHTRRNAAPVDGRVAILAGIWRATWAPPGGLAFDVRNVRLGSAGARLAPCWEASLPR